MASRRKKKPPKGSLSESVVWRSTGALKIGNLARRNEKQKVRLRKVKSTISNRLEPSVARARNSRKSRTRRVQKKRKPRRVVSARVRSAPSSQESVETRKPRRVVSARVRPAYSSQESVETRKPRRVISARVRPAPSSQESVDSPWVCKYHEGKKRKFWYNVETRETRWTAPSELNVAVAASPSLNRVRNRPSMLSPRARRAAFASAKRANSPRASRRKSSEVSLHEAMDVITRGRSARPLSDGADGAVKAAWGSPSKDPPTSAPAPAQRKLAFKPKPSHRSKKAPKGSTKATSKRLSGPKSDDIPNAVAAYKFDVQDRVGRLKPKPKQNRIMLRKRAVVVSAGTKSKSVLSPRVRRAARASAKKSISAVNRSSSKRAAAVAVAIAPSSRKEQKLRWKQILEPVRRVLHENKTHMARLKLMLYALDLDFSGMANNDRIREKLTVFHPALTEQEWSAVIGLFDRSGSGEMEYVDLLSLLSRPPEVVVPEPEPEVVPEPEPEVVPEPEPEVAPADDAKLSDEHKPNEAKLQEEDADADVGDDGADDADHHVEPEAADSDDLYQDDMFDTYQDDMFDDDTSDESKSAEDEAEDERPLKIKIQDLSSQEQSDLAAAVREAAKEFALEKRWLPVTEFRAVMKSAGKRLRLSRLDWQTLETVFGLHIQAEFGKDVNCIDYNGFLNFYIRG